MATVSRWAGWLLLTPLLFIGLCACADDGGSSVVSYQETFASFAENAPNAYVREILEAGAISDAAYTKILEDFTRCLSDQGITLRKVQSNGGTETNDPDYATRGDTQPVEICLRSTGFDAVGYLYNTMKNNPDNIDPGQLIAECLVRKRIVAEGYSARDYQRDMTNKSGFLLHPEDQEQLEAILECEQDPTRRP